jgi:hypothetical protein
MLVERALERRSPDEHGPMLVERALERRPPDEVPSDGHPRGAYSQLVVTRLQPGWEEQVVGLS